MLGALRRDLLSGQTIGPYRLLELVSQDGAVRVYAAEHLRRGARVAMIVIAPAPALPAEAIERFFREARAANALRHRWIAELLDLGTLEDGSPFVVTEALDGVTLADLALPVGLLGRLGAEVLDALAVAHDHGIVHGSLSPERVYVTADLHPKVLAFGARHLVPAPSSGEAGPRADLCAVGSIFREALTLDPFGAKGSERRRGSVSPQAIALDRAARPALVAVFERALAPADRYADAREMADAIWAAVRGLPYGELDTLPVARVHRPAVGRPAWLRLMAVAAVAAAAVAGLVGLAVALR